MRFRFLVFSPMVREKLRKLAGLHAVYTSEDVGQIVNRVNIITFARSYERKMGCGSHAACIRACKKAILAHEDKRFDSALTLVIVNIKVRIIQKTSQCKP